MNFLSPPPFLPETTGPEADARYKRLRAQVFAGAFIGYAAYYLVRKNFAMAIPMLSQFGIDKSELGIALGMNAVAYALSKFLMGSVSDRSDARKFLPLGLVLCSIAMACMAVPVTWLDLAHHPERKMLAIGIMAGLNFLVGWFGGMGWPPCGRVMTHWFSQNERGTMMSIWNCAHNVGGGLIGPMASYGAIWFGSWLYGTHEEFYFLAGTFLFPAAAVLPIALLTYLLLRDTPQSQGLPAVEKWRNDFPQHYNEESESVLRIRDIMLRHILPNKFLWAIALSNAFIYMVRYGCLDWAPALLRPRSGYQAGWMGILRLRICGHTWYAHLRHHQRPTLQGEPCLAHYGLHGTRGHLHRHLLVCLLAGDSEHKSHHTEPYGYRILHLWSCHAGGSTGPGSGAQERSRYGSRSDRLLRILLRHSHSGQHRHRTHLHACGLVLDVRISPAGLPPLHTAHDSHSRRKESMKMKE